MGLGGQGRRFTPDGRYGRCLAAFLAARSRETWWGGASVGRGYAKAPARWARRGLRGSGTVRCRWWRPGDPGIPGTPVFRAGAGLVPGWSRTSADTVAPATAMDVSGGARLRVGLRPLLQLHLGNEPGGQEGQRRRSARPRGTPSGSTPRNPPRSPRGPRPAACSAAPVWRPRAEAGRQVDPVQVAGQVPDEHVGEDRAEDRGAERPADGAEERGSRTWRRPARCAAPRSAR